MDFDSYIDNLSEQLVQTTQELIRIPSVKSSPLPGLPFGKNVHEALEFMLALGQSMGFKTKNVDGYVGYIECGDGEDLVGIMVHLDVVPEGTGWSYPPFSAEIHDGKIFGRGAIDDKGPAVASLYAMKAIQDSGIHLNKPRLNKRVRLILGLDEESGWACMDRYKQTEEIPSCAFTPDADYPVIHAEKGIVDYTFSQKFEMDNNDLKILSIKGGNRSNMVADFCEAVMEVKPELLEQAVQSFQQEMDNVNFHINIKVEGNKIILEVHGKSSHGSTPQKGINAISQLMFILYKSMQCLNIESPFIRFYYECIGLETDGKSMGCAMKDEVSGDLTFNVGLINIVPGRAEITVNIRYPVTHTLKEIYGHIQNTAQKFDIVMEQSHHHTPLYLPKEHPLVQKLMKVYRDFTGDMREPVAIGGGTYARALENAVAFGTAFPGDPELAHEKDEYITIDSLVKNSKIIARAIYELTK